MTNKEFAQTDVTFQRACDAVNLKATTRQAAKWRQRKGKAYVVGRRIHIINNEDDKGITESG